MRRLQLFLTIFNEALVDRDNVLAISDVILQPTAYSQI